MTTTDSNIDKAKNEQLPEKKTSIIETVKSPLGFFTLLVLVIEGILAVLVSTSTQAERILLIVAMTAAFLVSLFIVAFLAYKRPDALLGNVDSLDKPSSTSKQLVPYTFDAFVSSPMIGYESFDRFLVERQTVLEVISSLRSYCGLRSLFYQGEEVLSESQLRFLPDVGVKSTFEKLRKSRYFILIYPERVLSSVIYEAGYALALDKFSIYFVQNKSDLPSLLQVAPQVFSNVRIYEYADPQELLRIIQKYGVTIFSEGNRPF